METKQKLLLAAKCVMMPFLTSGCVFGAIYTNIHEPAVTNMRRTPRGIDEAKSETVQLSIPTTAANVSASWDSRAIGDAAQKQGLKEIYYADLHTISVLLGIWEKQTIEVYGSR